MQESPIHAGHEIPACAGMTRKLTFYESIMFNSKKFVIRNLQFVID